MAALKDLTGQTFGRLLIKSRATSLGKKTRWNALCSCGTSKQIHSVSLLNGDTKSCGCLSVELSAIREAKHGHARVAKHTRTFYCWAALWARCVNPNNARYSSYGGRGITVDPHWKEFSTFLRDMGEAPKGKQIDRIDNDLGYAASNCRWVTRLENARNKSNSVRFEYFGRMLNAQQLSTISGVGSKTITYRIQKGKWSVEKAVNTPGRVGKISR